MTQFEISQFIEKMEEIGDVWEASDVERVYGNKSLDEALADRMGDMNFMADIIGKVLNR
ncbi:hypothetical protein [Pseudobutyrivibrio xylanivorans]|uniref:Uncharacterized protein n=1 Tax=Pseudobutyrivibrio xylanivorans DSM 14809 TaxID=1123012 RepID=A0A1M6L1U7_PSEXY|nr:hypothetical protein [Pseudobutyrivibrio xylanivorans]SHJ65148.1 hypothetical protein SAMN02745725_02999 [Pseudobutyrivibrio xylanivorans DSM 14809]